VEPDEEVEYAALLDRLAQSKNADVRASAATMRARWLADLDAAKKRGLAR
jgi:hypothetical protein